MGSPELAEAPCPNHLIPLGLTEDTAPGLTSQVSEHLGQQPAVNVLVRDAHHMADNCRNQNKGVRGGWNVVQERSCVRILRALLCPS